MFIFDRCCRSSAAVTPVKYECDTNNLTGTSARSKILLTEKLTNGALVTPTPAGSALDGAVFDLAQILANLVHNMSRSQLYFGFGHFGSLSFGPIRFWWIYELYLGWGLLKPSTLNSLLCIIKNFQIYDMKSLNHGQNHRSMTSKSIMPTASSCTD